MEKSNQTLITPLQIRQKQPIEGIEAHVKDQPDWQTISAKQNRPSLLKNMAVASALVLCAVTLRTGAVPSLSTATDAIMTAATDQSLLDDQLGKLSFVSSMFPEAVLVFGESEAPELSLPVRDGEVIHTWSEAEPYVSLSACNNQVLSAATGEVIGIYHGNGDEKLVQVFSDGGLSCLYGNLENVHVEIGELVPVGQVIGNLLPGEELVFEARMNGYSVDPESFFQQ